jgi:hypothetical protein
MSTWAMRDTKVLKPYGAEHLHFRATRATGTNSVDRRI